MSNLDMVGIRWVTLIKYDHLVGPSCIAIYQIVDKMSDHIWTKYHTASRVRGSFLSTQRCNRDNRSSAPLKYGVRRRTIGPSLASSTIIDSKYPYDEEPKEFI